MTPIKLHWTIIIPFAMTVTSPSSFLVILMCYAFLLAHEFGHVLMGKLYGRYCQGIWLSAIGGAAMYEDEPLTPGEEIACALAGPLVNVFFCFVCAALVEYDPSFNNFWLQACLIINGFMAVFNLLPAFPMDGGRVVRATLWYHMDKTVATRISLVLTGLVATVSLFLGPYFAVIGVFLFVMIYFNWE